MSRGHFDRASHPNASCMMVAGKLFRVGTFLNFLRVPPAAGSPRKEKPLHQVEPRGKENHDDGDLPAKAHPRRFDAADVAEKVRDAHSCEERADHAACQRDAKEKSGTGPPRPVPRARNGIWWFPWTEWQIVLRGAQRYERKGKRYGRRGPIRRPSIPGFRKGFRDLT
jgi:hypothetical protein